jgi:TnpA family transposase
MRKSLGRLKRFGPRAASYHRTLDDIETNKSLLRLQNTALRRRVHVGLNKGEAKNALAKALFFNCLGEMRDRSFENQRYRASGLDSVVGAIILWPTIYLCFRSVLDSHS